MVGPESGAVKYAQYVAFFLSEFLPTNKEVKAIRARKCDGPGKNFYLAAKDIQLINGKRTLVVEDVFTTGESAAKVVAMVRLHNANVFGVGGVWNRGGVTAKDLGVDVFISQINQQYPTFEQGEKTCPACCDKIPYNMTFGHAKKLIGENPLAVAPSE